MSRSAQATVFRTLTTGLQTLMCVLASSLSGVGYTLAAPPGLPPAPAARLLEIQVPGTVPMGAAAIDLARAGYTEREFYAEGTANRYRGALPDALTAAEPIDGDWPFRTRVLVRTPQPNRFNGTLVVEWTNVTAGQDIDFAFAEVHDYLTREGYAVAVVSAQRAGVERLKTWNPHRYGTLSVNVGNVDPKGGANIDDCRGAPSCPGDALSWDILGQISKALKENVGEPKPLAGLKVEKVIALGESQSATRLTTYYNTIQPIHGLFDGFVFLDLARQLRSDQNIPAISVNSEVTAAMFPATTTSKYTRTWAVAGASHASLYGANYVNAMVLRDKSFPSPKGPLSFSQVVESQNCALTPFFSTVNSGLVLAAALDAVNKWTRGGSAAAPSRLIERDAAGNVVRDADGNAKGGIRLAQFTAPTAFLAPNGKPLFCVLSGHHRPFTPAELKSRYGTHEEYVRLVRSASAKSAEEGYILPADRDASVREAEDSAVAR